MTALPARLLLTAVSALTVACATATSPSAGTPQAATPALRPDPRVGLRGGLWDAAEATMGMRVVSRTRPPEGFVGFTNSDLAFTGHYVIQGNYHGPLIWDVANPAKPVLVRGYVCPASQNDVSVYGNLLFLSGENLAARLDCGTQGIPDSVSTERFRGIRIFDISDITNPRYVSTVQTCRGSHTHTVVPDPADPDVIYLYVSGRQPVRSPTELAGCSGLQPYEDPNSALFRIEVIRVPVAHPEQAAIVTSPRIFTDLVEPPTHGEAPEDVAAAAAAAAAARDTGAFTVTIEGLETVLTSQEVDPLLAQLVAQRGGAGAPTAADSARLRAMLPAIFAAQEQEGPVRPDGTRPGPNQCHDITVYPAIGRAGGACAGYGLLLDIRDVTHPKRIGAVSDSNFSFWHSATFNNDGTKLLFTDEWGGGGAPKCRVTDKPEWGADAIFTLAGDQLTFASYYKMPAPQTPQEVCVAHNGSLVPVPGRDIMVQSWYEGGVSVFDWTDAAHPREIAFFDRGPVDETRLGNGGSWSAYWYNGYIYSSEIARGLDVLELTPSEFLSADELAAAKLVQLEQLNVQSQPQLTWPASFVVARAYLDQLARGRGLAADRLAAARSALAEAEGRSGAERREALARLAEQLRGDAVGASDADRVQKLAAVIGELASPHHH